MFRNSAYILLLCVIVLISIGMVALSSVGAYVPANNGDQFYFLTRQAIFLAAGMVVLVVAARWDYHHWNKWTWLALLGGMVLMLLCFAPVIGVQVKGANRWLDLGFTRVQPVEAVKFAYVATLAAWLGFRQKTIETFRDGIFVPAIMLCAVVALCILQDDLGTSMLLILVTGVMLFLAGVRLAHLAPLPLLGVGGILIIALSMPQRMARIDAFLNPDAHATTAGYQALNSLIAFGTGGLTGRGLGKSVQKMHYLPEAHTDFIFPILGEELGLVCSLTVVLCYLLLVLSAFYISAHAPDRTGMLLGFGVTSLLAIQAAMNIAVVTRMVPTKGIGLPFISYGGSNLIMCFLVVGIILNIHRQAVYETGRHRGTLPPVMRGRAA